LTIQNDDLQGDDLEGFLRDTLTPAAAACKPGACWYVAAPAGPNFLPFAIVLTDLGIWRQTLVWVKDSLVLGRSDYHYRHEALFYGWTPGAAHQPPPTRDRDTIWECPRPMASPDHPTTKPTALVVRAIENSTKRGAIVLDAFCGAGTTILAAEQTKRRACGIELDSKYCDVIVRRWQEATGKEATLDGVPFSTVKESRGVE
ncbi:MAG: site-specific DNA-methyltransferase, partial [Planctomycetes bacterium]|nr:site-specific DNA-methyltransferase [Planctomycetota bacterium]